MNVADFFKLGSFSDCPFADSILSYPLELSYLCVMADCSPSALFTPDGKEASARGLAQPEPALLLDLRLVLENPSQATPCKGDKILVTGHLVPTIYPSSPQTTLTPVPLLKREEHGLPPCGQCEQAVHSDTLLTSKPGGTDRPAHHSQLPHPISQCEFTRVKPDFANGMLGLNNRTHIVLEVETMQISEGLDVGLFDRTARKMAHHMALQSALRKKVAEQSNHSS